MYKLQSGIVYTVRVSTRARQVRIDVYPDARVVVVVPHGASERMVERFVVEHTPWIERKVRAFEKHAAKGGVQLPQPKKGDYQKYKEQARALVHERLHHFNAYYGFTYNRVAIRAQRTRWGSCSSKGYLNFNYQIVHLPPAIADYLVVHELCHLKEMNHSPCFWALVEETIPNYKDLRKQLKYSRLRYV